MDAAQAFALGILQGLTEFLPVSSSGHLVLLQNLFGFEEPELLFDICLHIGTLAAVCVIFYRDIVELLRTLFRLPSLSSAHGGFWSLLAEHPEARMIALIVVGNVPTVALGLLFHQVIDTIFGSVLIVGGMMLVTGTILWMTRWAPADGRSVTLFTAKDALIIGLMQGLAILPGMSRSGVTISTALFLGINRELSGRYSFLLSIPAIVGALVLELNSGISHSIPIGIIIFGTLTAAVVGSVALVILLSMVKRGHLHRFSPYCWIVGGVAIAWGILF